MSRGDWKSTDYPIDPLRVLMLASECYGAYVVGMLLGMVLRA